MTYKNFLIDALAAFCQFGGVPKRDAELIAMQKRIARLAVAAATAIFLAACGGLLNTVGADAAAWAFSTIAAEARAAMEFSRATILPNLVWIGLLALIRIIRVALFLAEYASVLASAAVAIAAILHAVIVLQHRHWKLSRLSTLERGLIGMYLFIAALKIFDVFIGTNFLDPEALVIAAKHFSDATHYAALALPPVSR